jgi:dihydroxyacetone kinase-like protein
MYGKGINLATRNALANLIEYSDELRDLDVALGDGDLGVTVSLGAKAVIASLQDLPEDASPTEIAQTCATSFADANPSTMAALVAGALLAGSRVWEGKSEISLSDVAAFTRAAADSIAKHGRSQVGDKTILDAIVPAAEALSAEMNPAAALDAAIAAAEKAVQETKALQSRRGRASWLQERSIGLQDPGATAFWYLLRSWKEAN